jgi:hypothetical protein
MSLSTDDCTRRSQATRSSRNQLIRTKSVHDLPDELLLNIVTSMAHDKRDLDKLLAASLRNEVLVQINDCFLAKTIVKQHFSIAAMLYPSMASDISSLEEQQIYTEMLLPTCPFFPLPWTRSEQDHHTKHMIKLT